ncbi:MAG: hypothetical protein ACO32S_05530, partial [Steroidobacteraceae bacterium]
EYTYRTDSELGTLIAPDFAGACRQLDDMMTMDVLRDGAWGWVDDCESDDHYEVGPLPFEMRYPDASAP